MATALSRPVAGGIRRWMPSRPGRATGAYATGGPVPPLSPRLQLARAVLLVLCSLTITLLLQLTVISRLQHASAQQRQYDAFRAQLASGTAPSGPAEPIAPLDGSAPPELELGAPVAYLEIPELGLTEVVGEGTTAGVLFDGPGHRRDTVLPGQIGTSVVFGRSSTFGGPFADLDQLAAGDEFTVTTAQGEWEYAVLGVRREADPIPPPLAEGGSRLVLVTAAGGAFMPSGVLRVDADLVGTAVGGAARAYTEASLPAAERLMAGDPSTLWALALWLIALAGVATGAAWAWHTWGRAQAWVTCFPLLFLVALAASGEAARVLPNLA